MQAAHAPSAAALLPVLQDDFDIGAEEEASLDVKDRPEVQEKLERRIRSVEVKIINPPRPGLAAAQRLSTHTAAYKLTQPRHALVLLPCRL